MLEAHNQTNEWGTIQPCKYNGAANIAEGLLCYSYFLGQLNLYVQTVTMSVKDQSRGEESEFGLKVQVESL